MRGGGRSHLTYNGPIDGPTYITLETETFQRKTQTDMRSITQLKEKPKI